ncbi:MAG: VWA domain-containing protein [Hyphomicrobiaceae bacterium]|nr:VWA domain-containing protein [Hyphomicrobiaceae bacterium]
MLLRHFAFSKHLKLLALIFAAAFVFSFSINKALAAQVTLKTGMAQKLMTVGKGKHRTAYLHINLQGIALPKSKERAPVNVAIVIDKSGSMSGDKLRQAKRAAIMALGLLEAHDTISIVTYSSGVDVLVPATRLHDRVLIERRIEKIFSGGSTALYAGVKTGGEQLMRYLDREQVNRLILLSDGLANVGPKSPEALATLGYELVKKGVSVTTLGLGNGYNEDLMTRLANVTDGNHAFVETADELERFFALELGDITSVVAQDIEIEIHILPGYLPKRTLWRKSTIKGNIVRASIRQVYGSQKKDITLELQLPANKPLGTYEVANVSITYKDMGEKRKIVLSDKVSLTLTRSEKEADASIDKGVMSRVISLQAIEKNKAAMKLRDQGKIKAARRLYQRNSVFLNEQAAKLGAPALAKQAAQTKGYSQNLSRDKWRKYRKKQKHDSRSAGAASKY